MMAKFLLVLTAVSAVACALIGTSPAGFPGLDPAMLAAGRVSRSVPIRDRFARGRADLLRIINAERIADGLRPVVLDSLASIAAQRHAEAMANQRFFSHYDRAGRAPYERLAELGGTGHVLENVYRREERTEDPLLVDDPWLRFEPREAHDALMASPPHRAAILDPHRTAVGLGFSVDSAGRVVYVVEDFVARHAALTAVREWTKGRPGRVEGRVLTPGVRPLAIVLRREPAQRSWLGGDPPGGPYDDGGFDPRVVPPWDFTVRRDGTFAVDLKGDFPSGRWYGVLFVAPVREVDLAVRRSRAYTNQGWPGAAFVFEVRAP